MDVDVVQEDDGMLGIWIHTLGILTYADNSTEDVAKSVAEAVILMCIQLERSGESIEDLIRELG